MELDVNYTITILMFKLICILIIDPLKDKQSCKIFWKHRLLIYPLINNMLFKFEHIFKYENQLKLLEVFFINNIH